MRLFSVLLSILATFSLNAQLPFRIEGKADLPEATFAYLYLPASPAIKASIQQGRIVNRSFVFSGTFRLPSAGYAVARIYVDSSAAYKAAVVSDRKKTFSSFIEIVLDENLQLEISRDTILQKADGSNLNELFLQLKKIRSLKSSSIEQQLHYYSALSAFLVRHPSTVFSREIFDGITKLPSALVNKLVPDLLAVYSSVDSTWLTSASANNILAKISKANSVRKYRPGALLPDHIFYDGTDSVSIRQFRGKYLLLYFWASWSFPGRQYQHDLEAAFMQYPVHNFSILQVSLDRDINNWKNFFNGRKVLWKQARLVKGWDEAVVSAFDIKGLPQAYLIDPSGKIIGQNLTSRQIIEFLRKLPG